MLTVIRRLPDLNQFARLTTARGRSQRGLIRPIGGVCSGPGNSVLEWLTRFRNRAWCFRAADQSRGERGVAHRIADRRYERSADARVGTLNCGEMLAFCRVAGKFMRTSAVAGIGKGLDDQTAEDRGGQPVAAECW